MEYEFSFVLVLLAILIIGWLLLVYDSNDTSANKNNDLLSDIKPGTEWHIHEKNELEWDIQYGDTVQVLTISPNSKMVTFKFIITQNIMCCTAVKFKRNFDRDN